MTVSKLPVVDNRQVDKKRLVDFVDSVAENRNGDGLGCFSTLKCQCSIGRLIVNIRVSGTG